MGDASLPLKSTTLGGGTGNHNPETWSGTELKGFIK